MVHDIYKSVCSCSVCAVFLLALLSSCGGGYTANEDYSTIPATNNPAVTRHAATWQPNTVGY